MILAYLDESYSPKWPAYWMGAVVCPEHVVDPLTRDLDEVVRVASDKHGLELDAYAELHGQPLFHGRKEWSGLSGKPTPFLASVKQGLAVQFGVRVELKPMFVGRNSNHLIQVTRERVDNVLRANDRAHPVGRPFRRVGLVEIGQDHLPTLS